MPSIDKDSPEKLLFKKLLWKQGYLALLEVPVINFRDQTGDLRRDDLTDIDVIGFHYDETLTRTISIGDCKSADESQNRLLWLKGLQSYTSADHASFISRTISTKLSEVAKRLSISVWKDTDIRQILTDQNFSYDSIAVFNQSYHELEKKFWTSNASEDLRKYLLLLRYTYWKLPPKRRLQTIIFNFNRISSQLDKSDLAKFIVFQSLLRVTLSLLDIASYVIRHGNKSEVHRLVESYIFGSAEEVKEKKLVHESLNQGSKVKAEFYPPYYKGLMDIVFSLVRRSDCARDLGRFTESFWYEHAYAGNEFKPAQLFGDSEKTEVTVKLMKDIAIFLSKSSELNTEFFGELLKL